MANPTETIESCRQCNTRPANVHGIQVCPACGRVSDPHNA